MPVEPFARASGPDDARYEPMPQAELPTIEDLLSEAMYLVSSAKSMPLSSSVLLPREELLSVLETAIRAVPNEIKQARWMLRERDEYMDRAKLDAGEIIEAARARAEALVSKSDIVRQATSQANHLTQRAKEEAAKLKRDATDYADQQLASLELTLEGTLKSIKAGRDRLDSAALSVVKLNAPEPTAESMRLIEDAFFDQDRD